MVGFLGVLFLRGVGIICISACSCGFGWVCLLELWVSGCFLVRVCSSWCWLGY